ncbi:MAG: hypothetical protein IPL71_15240 [Anaerolineales bacterium]|uniref:hypothetical protein n=1 Tax=Candidatus Villigracilis proximus TaxID=3140683 RepID=UPI003136F86E|nr:hypothetical protein [Anaerolineales bacterium]
MPSPSVRARVSTPVVLTDWAGNANANYIARFKPASTTITVITNADELNVDGDCSLREAMQSAELNIATDACAVGNASGPDIIVFHNSLGTTSILLNANLQGLSKTLAFNPFLEAATSPSMATMPTACLL